MRGLESGKMHLRHEVFTEVARMAFEGGNYERKLEQLPYKIIPGEVETYRENVVLERAIVSEQLRLAMGLPLRSASEYVPMADGLDNGDVFEHYYEKPLVNIIKFACNKCPDDQMVVTSACQGCLEHPCLEVCPKHAVFRKDGKAHIDPARCVHCGLCMKACQFNAIIHQERPCRKACGINCIGSDMLGRAEIDYRKCTSCGQCLVNCPFGAIADKSQIFQTITAIKSHVPIYVVLAPAFVGQFGVDVTPGKLCAALQKLGFDGVYEAAIGADLCILQEAMEFLECVPSKQRFMVTSCCPSWSDLVKKFSPEMSHNISLALTPMVLTARMVKRKHPDCKVVFIGPCDSKKLEAHRRTVRSDVDFVLTFEEVLGMFDAKGIDPHDIPPEEEVEINRASTDARRFAVSGGVADAVANMIHQLDPTREVKIARANGLNECLKLLLLARCGKYDGYLLEGMACPGGCIAGAGTLQPIQQSHKQVEAFSQSAAFAHASDTPYREYLDLVTVLDGKQ